MKSWFIKRGTRQRLMVRTNDAPTIEAVENYAQRYGFTRVGLIGFWWAVLTAKRPKRVGEVDEANDTPGAGE